MKRALILCLFLFMAEGAGNGATNFLPPLQPMNATKDMGNYTNSVTQLPDQFANKPTPSITSGPDVNAGYPKITQIETSLYGKTFENLDIIQRVSRIEQTLFNKTYPRSSLIQRVDNIMSNYNQLNKYPNISKNVLSKMEARVFSRTYVKENPQRRIERLEQQLFGAVQSGDINARYDSLKTAVGNYNPNNVEYYPGAAPTTGWNGLTANFGNSMMSNSTMANPMLGGPRMGSSRIGRSLLGTLGGTMTGFTPPITPYYNDLGGNNNGYNAYPNPANNSGIYRGYRSNHGYSDSYQDYGTGTGVTILD